MARKKIKINRAPVLTLWATVVAKRLGYDENTALTLGKAVAGLNAQSKGRKLGIYEEKSEEEKAKERKKKESAKTEFIEILGRGVPAIKTPRGLRAAIDGEPIHAESVDTYLKQKFKDDYDDARAAMEKLAKAYTPKQLEIRKAERIERWVAMYRKEGELSFHKPKGRPRKAEEEQSELKRLRMENALLKKFHSELRELPLAPRNIGQLNTTKTNTK